MKRHPPLTKELIESILDVDVIEGKCFWKNVSKHHSEKNGKEAGCVCRGDHGQSYWIIRIGRVGYKRSYLVFVVGTGRWPNIMLDHINGNSLEDSLLNLREATVTQNAWNHRTRKKKATTPMGVRQIPSGRFTARIAFNKKQICVGTFDTAAEAFVAYQQKRKELFGEYSGL